VNLKEDRQPAVNEEGDCGKPADEPGVPRTRETPPPGAAITRPHRYPNDASSPAHDVF
jgi:hypothetical protein